MQAIKDTMDAPAVADWRTGAAALLLSLHVAIVMPCCQGKPATAAEYPPAQVTAGQAVFNNNCGAYHYSSDARPSHFSLQLVSCISVIFRMH